MLSRAAQWLLVMAGGATLWWITATTATSSGAPGWLAPVATGLGVATLVMGTFGLTREIVFRLLGRGPDADADRAHRLIGQIRAETHAMLVQVEVVPQMTWVEQKTERLAAAEELAVRARDVVRDWYRSDEVGFAALSAIDAAPHATQWLVQEQLRRIEAYLSGLQSLPPTSRPGQRRH